MRDLVFTLLFGGLMVPALMWPWFGVLIWAWLDYMNPHRLCYSFAKYTIPFSLISALTAIGMNLISTDRKRFPVTRETILLILFVCWMTVTSFFALNPQEVWIEWDRVIKIQLLIIMTLVVINSPMRLNALIWTIVLSLGFFGVKGGLFTLLSGGAHRVYGPEHTFIEDNNDLALALVTTLPLMRYLQLRVESAWVRWGLGAAMLLTTVSIIGSYSRGGLVGLIVVVALMILKSRKKLLFGTCLFVFLPLVIKMMPEEWHNRMDTIQTYKEDSSAQGRFNAWWFAWNVAEDRPIVGGGFRVFRKFLFEKYAPDPEDYHEAHNIFFKVLGEHGFIGLTLFLGLAFFTWRSATWIRKRVKLLPEFAWAGDLASMSQVSLAAFGVGGSFLNLAYFDLPYHLMTMVVITKMMVRDAMVEAATEERETLAGGTPQPAYL